MSGVTSQEIIRLYRNLLRYGNQLKYTDKSFYLQRIREEFHRNRGLKTKEDIEFNFKVNY